MRTSFLNSLRTTQDQKALHSIRRRTLDNHIVFTKPDKRDTVITTVKISYADKTLGFINIKSGNFLLLKKNKQSNLSSDDGHLVIEIHVDSVYSLHQRFKIVQE